MTDATITPKILYPYSTFEKLMILERQTTDRLKVALQDPKDALLANYLSNVLAQLQDHRALARKNLLSPNT